jgi:hypothetical protein
MKLERRPSIRRNGEASAEFTVKDLKAGYQVFSVLGTNGNGDFAAIQSGIDLRAEAAVILVQVLIVVAFE